MKNLAYWVLFSLLPLGLTGCSDFDPIFEGVDAIDGDTPSGDAGVAIPPDAGPPTPEDAGPGTSPEPAPVPTPAPTPTPTSQPDAPELHVRALALGSTHVALDINRDRTFTYDVSNPVSNPPVNYHLSGTCSDPSPGFGVRTCVIGATDNAETPVGTELRFKSLSGVLTVLAPRLPHQPPTPEPTDFFQVESPAFLFELSGDCGSLEGDYGFVAPNSEKVTFGVTRMDPPNLSLRHTDFTITARDTSFGTAYVTEAGGGNGIENVLSAHCEAGVWTLMVEPAGGGAPVARTLYETRSGLVIDDMTFAVPRSLALPVEDLQGLAFDGIEVIGDDLDPFEVRMSSKLGNSVSASAFANASGQKSPLASLQLIEVSDPLLAPRFSAATAASNGLGSLYPTGASTPGLYYAPQINDDGAEQPGLVLALRSRQDGAIILFGLWSGRSGEAFRSDALIFATSR